MNTTKKSLHQIKGLSATSKEELTEIIKQYLKELCEYSGISINSIAEEVGLSRISIWRIRNGKHKSVHFEYGVRIANLHDRVFGRKKKAVNES